MGGMTGEKDWKRWRRGGGVGARGRVGVRGL